MDIFKEEKHMNKTKTNLSAPWYIYCEKLKALFEDDEEIDVLDVVMKRNVEYLYDYCIRVEIYNVDKYEAFKRLVPNIMSFGNVNVAIEPIQITARPKIIESDPIKDFNTLFNGNLSFYEAMAIEDDAGCKHKYVIFEPDAVQYYADDMTDYCGNQTKLIAEVAKDIFPHLVGEINFCTAEISDEEEEDEE